MTKIRVRKRERLVDFNEVGKEKILTYQLDANCGVDNSVFVCCRKEDDNYYEEFSMRLGHPVKCGDDSCMSLNREELTRLRDMLTRVLTETAVEEMVKVDE